MKNNKVILILIMYLVLGCEKEPSNNQDINTLTKYTFLIINKSDTVSKLIYSDSLIFLYKTMENNMFEETYYHYDSIGLLIGLTTNNVKNNLKTFKDFYYDSVKRISTIKVCQILQNGDSLKEVQTLDYNENGKLININAFLPETFEYENSNVIKNGNVNVDKAIWTDYSLSYDNYNNPFYNIGLPMISVKELSQNNIITKIAKWIEYPDCMVPGDVNCKPINHNDTIYTSTFEYNNDNKPKFEYRKSKSGIDTLRFIYK
jgi:hypothetical protein